MRRLSIALALAAVLLGAAPVRAEWQLKPFAGLTFGGNTTIVDSELAIGTPNFVVGGNASLLGEIFGVEVDLGYAPGFFDRGDQILVAKSYLTTVTGNVIIGLPRSMVEYGLRPYFVGGAGLMRISTTKSLDALAVANSFGTVDLGGGVTGFFSENFGVSWELRHFRSVDANSSVPPGLIIPGEDAQLDARLSFWRATMALVYRY